MKVVVTGAAGFIGSNLVHGLNRIGVTDVVAVDDLSDGSKHANLASSRLSDYFDHEEFYRRFSCNELGRFDVIFHQGACSNTMEQDGRFMMRTNYRCSKDLLDACAKQGTRLIYASSAAVYGGSSSFAEAPANERPLNVYGYSKLLFDEVVRRRLSHAPPQVVGLRYFNVYGPREQHKGRMASVAFHHFNEFRTEGAVKLFGAYGGYEAGQQQRDFVSVDDVVAINLWFLEHPERSGIFNLGTGRAQPFNDIAMAVINACRKKAGERDLSIEDAISQHLLRYVPFPAALAGKYQCHTQADISALRRVGCEIEFSDVATGVARYVNWLTAR